jgi:hypothetical protein
MSPPHAKLGCEASFWIEEKWAHNPLIRSVGPVIGRVANLKERVRAFYFEVILSPYQCPRCGGRLHMAGQSQAACSCGNTLDPTISFQRSPCCGVELVKKTFHYACSGCHQTVPSRFLFDERIFDAAYFREMMQESRARAMQRKEEVGRLLAESRSDSLHLTEDPDLGSIPGLIQDLDDFIQENPPEIGQRCFSGKSDFAISDYREHILSALSWDSMLFSDISPLIQNLRADKAWRFITVVFMDHEREIELVQHGNDLVIQRAHNAAYA